MLSAVQGAAKSQGSKLLRSVECYDTAVGFVDSTDVTSWKVLHLNGPAVDLLGGRQEQTGVWHLLACRYLCPASHIRFSPQTCT